MNYMFHFYNYLTSCPVPISLIIYLVLCVKNKNEYVINKVNGENLIIAWTLHLTLLCKMLIQICLYAISVDMNSFQSFFYLCELKLLLMIS